MSDKHPNDALDRSHPHFRWRGADTLQGVKQLPEGFLDALAEAAQKKLGPPDRTGRRLTIPLTDGERNGIAKRFGF